MNFLILGDGPEESAWARTLADRADHRIVAAWPGLPGIPPSADLDDALAARDVTAVIVGGRLGDRDEALRRVAAAGLAAVCLHPPGPNADAYYQVALSREETGAVVIPDLAGRLHPGIARLRAAEIGEFRGLRVEATGELDDPDLALRPFARQADLVRALLGEITSLTALGDPPGSSPSRSLTVQFRAADGRVGELRLVPASPGATARVVLLGEEGSAAFEIDPGWEGPGSLALTRVGGQEIREVIPAFDPRTALLDVLALASEGRQGHPDLIDGTRAMELTSAVARSLRKGRSVDLHYEEVSEANNFKTVMTSVGCMVLLAILVVLPVALAGPALGFGQTIYIAYAIPPVLIAFALLQLLRFGVKPAGARRGPPRDDDDESEDRTAF